jgi:hypothetical protein
MKGRLCLTAVSMLMLTLGSLSALVPTASGQGSWTAMADTPDPNYPVGMGGSLTYASSDYIYAFQGHAASGETPQIGKFWRYSISGNAWTSMADAPDEVAWGGALTWAGGDYIYALRGNGTDDFWRYSISGDSWTTVANTPTRGVRWGGSLAWTMDDFIYAFRGDYTTTFWRYSIAANTWVTMTAAPDTIHAGGALAWAGGDYIYALRGNGTTDFWCYSISGGSWETMAATPSAVGEGGALTHDGGDYIYALRGNGTGDFWRYNISTDRWETMNTTPAAVGMGGALSYTAYFQLNISSTLVLLPPRLRGNQSRTLTIEKSRLLW